MRSSKRNRTPSHANQASKLARSAAAASPFESLETRLYLTAAAYTWQNANIGAGGFVDGIYYDQSNQNTIYARTDIGGLYKSTNDGSSWTQLLDFVGSGGAANDYNGFATSDQDIGVLSFAIDPQNSNDLYADVGEYSGTDGMILYSRNGGQTWSNYNLSFYVGGNSNGRGDGDQLAVDPNDDNILFLGTNNDGLWYSTNALSSTGPTFTQFSNSVFSTSTSTTFVLFDAASGTTGSPTATIFVGINSTSTGTNLFETTNGGTSFAQVTGTGSLPSGYLPGHGVISNGYLYLGYANGEAPNTTLTNGGVYRYSISGNSWSNISPVATNGKFGYDAVAVDPENPNTIVVSSFDYYDGPDQMWRTVNANASTPTWTEVYDYASAQGYGYNGYDNTRNTTNAPWIAAFGDGISNWATAIAINPFNSNQLMYGTGQGIWATNNISNSGANTQLTAANSWYFPDTGIEFTAVGSVVAPTSGVPLFSAMGDIGGFAQSTLNYSPEQGSVGGSGDSTDYAGANPADAAIVGSMGTYNGAYTANGSTFTPFAGNPATTFSVTSITRSGTTATAITSSANNFSAGQTVLIAGASPSGYDGSFTIASIINSTTFTYTVSNSLSTPATGTITAIVPYSQGTVAISANGSTIVWAPSTKGAYYSTNDGASWTLATLGASGTLPTGGVIVSDKVNPNYFYYWTENTTDNSWTLYISSDGGQQFTLSTLGSIATGNVTLAASPYVAGQLWMGGWNGIYEIVLTNLASGTPTQNITHVANSTVDVDSNDLALGAPAPGTTTPAIYIYGTTPGSSFVGVWRSDNGGTTWLQLNNINEQWGGLIQTIAADPNVFGRVYLGVNGRGILVGNPTTSLPANWIDTDINDPGNPGWATNSVTLSTGTVVNQWNIVGGGAGYSASPISISSLSVTNDVATAISTAANGFQVGQLVTIAGASNSTFDGTFAITSLANSPASYSAGIPSATEFTFALTAPNSTATGTITATLDDQFNYAYQSIAGNGSLSAELTGLTNADGNGDLSQAGVMYRAGTSADDPFIEIAQNSAGNLILEYRTTTGGSVTTQTVLSGLPIGSEYVQIGRNGSNFTASYSSNGSSWTTAATVTIAAMPSTANLGLASTASYNPQLADATFTNVSLTTAPVLSTPTANPNPVTGTSTALSVQGSGGTSALTYTWSYTGPTGVTYTNATNGSTTANNITANFSQIGNYQFTVTASDSAGDMTTASLSVTVQQSAASIVVSPSNSPVLPVGSTQQFTATATDQFGNSISSPSFNWAITGSANFITTSGDATLGSAPGTFTVSATSGTAKGTANIIAENFAVPSGSTLDINLGSAGPVTLTSSGSNITASQNGVQITLSGFTAIAVTDTGSNDILNVNSSTGLPFTFTNCASATLNVSSATLTFAAEPGATFTIGTLTLSSSATAVITPTSTDSPTILTLAALNIDNTSALDVTNNEVMLNYGSAPDPIDQIANWIASGHNGGAWNGLGITSTTAQSNPAYAVGYADGVDSGDPANIYPGQIKILYTLSGDANLDGQVNGEDFVLMSDNFNQAVTAGWDKGDFDYSGAVNGADFILLANNFNQGAQIADPAAAVASVQSTATPTNTTSTSTSTSNTPSAVTTPPATIQTIQTPAQATTTPSKPHKSHHAKHHKGK